VIKIVRHFARENKSIAAVCHGAQLRAAAGVIAGKRVSAFPACAPEVTLAGAEYAQIALDQAITDEVLVTAPAWPAHAAWLAQFLIVLGTRIAHGSRYGG
jgi:protease I